MIWIIEDWAGNCLFPNRTFATFEDGWAYVTEHCPVKDWQDIYVVEEN